MDMGKAISQKIREAIRAKLIDLGNYVDEELPDYIMVMIANKKTEVQMKEDLALFLGSNTDKFCGWLQGVLTKLQAARNEQKERKEKAKEKKKKSKKKEEKKEKKRNSSGGEKEKKAKEGEEEGSSPKKDSADTAKLATDSESKKQLAGQNATEEPSTSSGMSKEHVKVQEKTEATGHTYLVAPSEPVISLLPDTNDFLDEEIKMSDSVKKVSMESKQSKSLKGKESAPMKALTKVSLPKAEWKEAPPTTTALSDFQKKSPPVVVTVSARADRSGQELAGRSRIVEEPARMSVKARLGIPATKQRPIVERHREMPTLSKVVRVPAVPIKRSGPGSVIGQVIQGEEEFSDDEPATKKIASTVKPRRRQPLPKTKQNSMALLKKAMTQATESTSVFPAAGQFSEPVRMIVRSTSQSGTMKVVARSIPADKEESKEARLPQKKLLVTAIQVEKQSVDDAKLTRKKTAVSVKPLGLMSRSRFNETRERNFDAHEYQRVDDKDKGTGEREEEEERVEVEEEEDGKNKAAEETNEVEEVEEERQIIQITEGPEKLQLHIEELTEGMEGELEEEQELNEEEEEEEAEVEENEQEMDMQEQVCDTRTTKIVRPLQFERLAELQKRVEAPPLPPPQPVEALSKSKDMNPYFIVTLEGKKKGVPTPQPVLPQRNLVLSSPVEPSYQPTPITALTTRLHLPHYDSQQEMETEVPEEKYLEYEPVQRMEYHQIVLKEKSPVVMFEKDSAIGRVISAEPQVVKDSVFSPPQPKIEPVTFSLHESDEEHAETIMEEEKVNERCKFWPACKNGSECPYVHPSTPCKTFPNCKYGDKCLFIHPNCKFDATCMNPTCPYTHATRTKPTPVIIQAPQIRTIPNFRPAQTKTVCKFHPKCTNTRCPFLHPKMCRYNRSCTRPDCKFTHSQVASRSAMKWTKEQHISERKFVSKLPSS